MIFFDQQTESFASTYAFSTNVTKSTVKTWLKSRGLLFLFYNLLSLPVDKDNDTAVDYLVTLLLIVSDNTWSGGFKYDDTIVGMRPDQRSYWDSSKLGKP